MLQRRGVLVLSAEVPVLPGLDVAVVRQHAHDLQELDLARQLRKLVLEKKIIVISTPRYIRRVQMPFASEILMYSAE